MIHALIRTTVLFEKMYYVCMFFFHIAQRSSWFIYCNEIPLTVEVLEVILVWGLVWNNSFLWFLMYCLISISAPPSQVGNTLVQPDQHLCCFEDNLGKLLRDMIRHICCFKHYHAILSRNWKSETGYYVTSSFCESFLFVLIPHVELGQGCCNHIGESFDIPAFGMFWLVHVWFPESVLLW